MLFFHEALLTNLKFSIKDGLRKALAPDFIFEQAGGSELAGEEDRLPVEPASFDLILWPGGLDSIELHNSGATPVDLGGWQVPPTYDDGVMLRDATLAQGLEGIVSKRSDGRYIGGRGSTWLKIKALKTGEAVGLLPSNQPPFRKLM